MTTGQVSSSTSPFRQKLSIEDEVFSISQQMHFIRWELWSITGCENNTEVVLCIYICVWVWVTGVCAAHVSRCLWRATHLINDQHPVLLWHSWMSLPPTERKWMNMNVPEVNGIQSNQCICQKPCLLPQNYSPLLIKPPDKQTQDRSSAHKNWWRPENNN